MKNKHTNKQLKAKSELYTRNINNNAQINHQILMANLNSYVIGFQDEKTLTFYITSKQEYNLTKHEDVHFLVPQDTNFTIKP